MQRLFKTFSSHTYVFLILVIASILRFLFIDQMPSSLNWDEISHGYNAYSILETGKDEWGNTFPTIFRAYGDYKLPTYIYLTAVSIFFFGLTEFAVRLVSVLAGIFLVLFTHLLTYKITDKKETALWAGFLVAIEPWTLFISRGAFEANLALAFIVSGVYFFLKGLENSKYYIISLSLLGLSVWTYNSARVFTPLLLVILFLIYRKEVIRVFKKDRLGKVFFLLPLFVFFIPMFYQLLNPVGQARYSKVAILDESAIYQIEEMRTNSQMPFVAEKLLYNRYSYVIFHTTQNIGKHYTPDFLFLNGGTQYQFSVPNHGLLYWVTLPFLLIGIVVLLFKQNRYSILILSWFLIGSVASSITREAPHVLRSITMLPIPMIVTAVGITKVLEWMEKYKKNYALSLGLSFVFVVSLFLSLERYMVRYFQEYKTTYSWSWQYGYKEVVNYTREKYDEYDHIIVTKKYGEPHEFFLFYNKWNPEDFRSDTRLIRYMQSDWFWVDRFDKYWFVNDWQIKERESNNEFITESKKVIPCNPGIEKCLLITSPGNAPVGWSTIKTVFFLNGEPAFELYEN